MTSELYRFTGDTTGPMTAARPPRVRQATLPVARQSPGLARQVARDALMSWQLTHLTDTAILLISELVTNAVLHARTNGLGLVLVDSLADKWGVRETPAGKAVWAELDTRPDGEPV